MRKNYGSQPRRGLTEQEISDRLNLERKVERAFFEAGKALAQLRDRRLYRSTHRTFEEYCRDRFGYTHRRVNYLIAGSVVFDNIVTGTNCSQNEGVDETGTNCSQNEEADKTRLNPSRILPTNEGQVRPLAPLEPQQQVKVWQRAVQEAGGKVPSARIVTDVVQKIIEPTRIPNTYQTGEVCQILVKDNPDLRGKGGCWCIVVAVHDFSCTVRLWDGELTVGLKYLKSYDYLPQECKQMQIISDRMTRLRQNENLEEAGRAVLKYLGELKRPYLTQVEQKLLSLIELECEMEG
ncbi:hypothetical protein H6G97_38440 [Nostoc flagelliforme FACHB-838]|uniref:Site-specific DNA-cytosine methylase n=1 Tax=Nostoc flagelliforme FACHB-838 TaxID=2692904 RepID=A0ABR8E0B0_9NOSO|nr:hypothetical protein [Nostoc flagelliforme]MBD2534994.1 hypothetical protein [Nostoc flagelliforme FACHB-838]